MKKEIGVFLFAAVLIAGASGRIRGQEFQPEDGDDQVITVEVDLVSILFSVTDRDGRYITDLTADDFVVYEDNVPQRITNFEAQTDLPLILGLVIDISGSVRDKLRFEQEAATEFFYSTLQRDRDRAMLVAFDTGVTLVQDFTRDPEDLAIAVGKLRSGGSSALYDAVWLSVNEMTKQAGDGRRILIVISDGDDTASRKSLTETLEMAHRNDVSVYSISTNGTANFENSSQERGDRALGTFADETGGRAFFPFKIQELAVNFAEITDELRAQYTLGYVSTNPARDGRFRRVRIRPRNGDYRVGARDGYYAPTEPDVDEP